jgi:hypothetical protein
VSATNNVVNQVFDIVCSNPSNAGASENQIANQAFSALVDARNGFYGASNEFSFLATVDLPTIVNADHFAQAYAVSTGDTLLENQLAGFVFGGIVDPVYNAIKQITQDFGFDFLDTGTGPQAPADFSFWALDGAYAALAEEPPGQVNLLAGARNGPTAIDGLHPRHDPYEIFGDGEITTHQFLQAS